MNGMRRFLTGNLGPSTQPDPSSPPPAGVQQTTTSGKPSWPPSTPPSQTAGPLIAQSLSESPTPSSPKSSVAALLFRRDKQHPALPQSGTDDDPSYSRPNSATTSITSSLSPSQSYATSSASPSRILPRKVIHVSGKSVDRNDGDHHRVSDLLNVRDELLMSLLASEAVVDSRGFDILSSEEVEDLKKEHQVLTSRVAAATKKLTLETKIRDAAISLSKVNSPYKTISKQTSDQLETANRKVELAQKELWRVSERANAINRQLLEHRAGVLSFTVRNMEKQQSSSASTLYPSIPSGTETSLSSLGSYVSSPAHAKFEHFVAGHADSVVPRAPKAPMSSVDIAELEDQLHSATQKLHSANKKQAEMLRDLSLLKLEKEQVETSMEMELQTAEETIDDLEREISKLGNVDAELRAFHEEKRSWENERVELEARRKEVETLEGRLEVLEERSGEVTEMKRLLDQKDREIAQLRHQQEADRIRWEEERSSAQLDETYTALQTLIQNHGIMPPSSNTGPSLPGLVECISSHLERVAEARSNLEEDLNGGLEKQEGLAQALEGARAEQEESRVEIRFLESQAREQSDRIAELVAQQSSASAAPVEYTGDAEKVVAALMPIWTILPSAEARAAKLGQNRFRSQTSGSNAGNPMKPSLSEMDVRSLKTLYDNSKPGQPQMITTVFTIEVFVARVQALISDDRALIERLLRFAQAHDLLKKNAERAQKLALDSNVALETYQKQVKMLEDRDAILFDKNAVLMDGLQLLQDTVERVESEKRDLEMQAADQAETCRQLTDANNALSAKTLSLAAEAASATDAIRRQMDAQLAECKASLQRAHTEIDTMQNSEQTQRVALLEELNSMQTENSNLRAQLRNVQGKK